MSPLPLQVGPKLTPSLQLLEGTKLAPRLLYHEGGNPTPRLPFQNGAEPVSLLLLPPATGGLKLTPYRGPNPRVYSLSRRVPSPDWSIQ